MRVLIIGSSGVEHAIANKLAADNSAEMIFVTPGNPGIEKVANCINIPESQINELLEFAMENMIDFTIATSKTALEDGIVDKFRANNLLIFGPDLNSQKITSQRSYAKKLCYKYKVPITKFGVFEKEAAAVEFLKTVKYPVAIKLDSQNSAVNTYICETPVFAQQMIEPILSNDNKKVIIEEYIEGKDITLSVITDGYNAVPLPACVSYFHAQDCGGGPITKGTGAYAPASAISYETEGFIAGNIVFPIIDALNNEKTPYSGILTFRMKLTPQGQIFLTDIDSVLGNPEAQTILPLLEEDLLRIFYSTAIGALGDDYESFITNDKFSATAMLLSGAYPFDFKQNFPIEIEPELDEDIIVCQNQTIRNKYYETVTKGGRPVSVTALGSTLNIAREKLYSAIECINFENKRYRKDIAQNKVIEL